MGKGNCGRESTKWATKIGTKIRIKGALALPHRRRSGDEMKQYNLRLRTSSSTGLAGEGPGFGSFDGMGVGREGSGPGDVAVTSGVEGVTGLTEDPLAADEGFAEGEEIGGDIVVAFGKAFFATGELIHEGEAEVRFFGAEVDFGEAAGEMLGGLPADLAAEAGLVASALDFGAVGEEVEEDGFEEMPIIGTSGEEGTEPKDGADGFSEIHGGEVALARSGDIEAEADGDDLGIGRAISGGSEQKRERAADELLDLGGASAFVVK
jgi:hypothetical protein